MPIGPEVPGEPTEVTPDTAPPVYSSVYGPAPDGVIVADDVNAALLVALNVQRAGKRITFKAVNDIAIETQTSTDARDIADTLIENLQPGDMIEISIGPLWVGSGGGTAGLSIQIHENTTLMYTTEFVVPNYFPITSVTVPLIYTVVSGDAVGISLWLRSDGANEASCAFPLNDYQWIVGTITSPTATV